VIERFGQAARESGRPLDVLVDLEVGGRRTGALEQEAVSLAQLISETDGLRYAGVQGYVGGHQTTKDYEARRKRSEQLLEPLRRAVERLGAAGLAPGIVSGGGTGTHDFDHEVGLLTEIQVGTYIFMDVHYRDVPTRPDDPHPFGAALSVRTTVVSAAQPDFVVTDAGIKELDAMFDIDRPVILRGGPSDALYSLVGDDMGRIEMPNASAELPVGSVLEVQPPHCPVTAPMYPYYHAVRGDVLEDIWPVDARLSW
jgi:D-serine deaminase-like pyridoxal phosphate-dependent protein